MASEREGRQGALRVQSCRIQDVSFQEPLKYDGSWLERKRHKLDRLAYRIYGITQVVNEAVAGFAHLYA